MEKEMNTCGCKTEKTSKLSQIIIVMLFVCLVAVFKNTTTSYFTLLGFVSGMIFTFGIHYDVLNKLRYLIK